MLGELAQGNELVADPELLAAFNSAQNPDVDNRELSAEATATATADQDSVDPEILEIFLEEAGEIMDQLEQLLGDLRKDPANKHFNQEAQRALHTLKGGARLSQLTLLGIELIPLKLA